MSQERNWTRRLYAALLAIIAVAGGWWVGRGQEFEQPIQFNHALHIKNNVECNICHPYYETTTRAGLPGVSTCRRCHEDVIKVGREERKIETYYQSNRDIPWQQVYRLASHVYFSHRRHAALGGIACAECHGDVAAAQRPLSAPLKTLSMDRCIECHQRNQDKTSITNVRECIRCHR